ncbi:GntR family transcriptional regulator [Caballeronia sp. dw_19]|jgi:DNA-binding GntR family transcriptional regulator|uniref:GntR family transcriptional regulator n=1 Tax=unclassified Caballeronia TaxID=2646786 RepID=UPI00210489F7|nr:GntR family transcriptional regulator [Caballeronia sp. dw_19]
MHMTFWTKLDQVAERLRERIISGEYKRGDKLKQADIAAELGVSITPVREALKVLEMEGFVVSVPHKGLSVPEIEPERAREIFELRVMLERSLTEKALARITKEEIAEIRTLHRELTALVKAREVYPVRAANVRFHFRLYEIADCPQTLQFVRVLWAKYPFNFHDDQAVRFKQLLQEHGEIIRALESGDKKVALAAMINHIESGWNRVSDNVMSTKHP